jgi:Fe-S-cluster containining protein
MSARRPAGDSKLVQIVDHALADAAERAGDWLACRPGCTQCCVGVFAINQLDVVRLQHGLRELRKSDPARAAGIVSRAQSQVDRLSAEFPGNAKTGTLGRTPALQDRFEQFANDEVCPALDPNSGLCELYEYRPMTCRTFGPPVRSEDGLGVCELCFQGATDEQIAACEMVPDPDDLESKLVRQVENTTTKRGETIVAWCLADEPL